MTVAAFVLVAGVLLGVAVLALVERRLRLPRWGAAYCPDCNRRLKRGATSCRRCGYEIVPSRASSSSVYVPAVYKRRALDVPDAEPEREGHSTGTISERLRRPFRKKYFVPSWIVMPLAWLGLLYLSMPWRHDWYTYGFGLLTAVAYGVWARKRYRVTVLHRYDGGAVIWLRWSRNDEESEKPPVVVLGEPADDGVPTVDVTTLRA
jgi:hypothetical protein